MSLLSIHAYKHLKNIARTTFGMKYCFAGVPCVDRLYRQSSISWLRPSSLEAKMFVITLKDHQKYV
jgi:hypothetical protein